MYSLGRRLKVPHGILKRRTRANIQGQKHEGPQAPRVFGLWSGLGCGLGYAFRKSLGGPSIFSLGSTLSTLGKLPRGSIHHATSSAFPQIVSFWGQQKSAVDSGQLDKIRTSELINHFLVFTNTVCSVWWEVPLTSPISCSIYEDIFS